MARKQPDNMPEDQPVRKPELEIEGDDMDVQARSRLIARAEKTMVIEEEPTQNSPQYVQLRFSRKFLLRLGFVLILVGLGVLVWQQDLYQTALNTYNRASVVLRVREGETIVLPGATVVINGQKYASDDAGSIVIAEIVAGKYDVTAARDGYDSLSTSIEIARGDNGAKILTLTKKPIPLYTLNAVINDQVSGLPVKGVQVSGSSRTITTGESGEANFEKLPAGKYQLTLSKSGYRDAQQEVILSADSKPTAISIVPSGQVVFTSKRTGRRGIYSANLDGSNQLQIASATNSPQSEDYAPRLSPDGRYIAFASTRDGVVSKFGTTLAKMYISDATGRNAKAINSGFFVGGPWWSSDGALVAFTYATDATLEQTRILIYNPAKDAIFLPGDNVDPFAGYMFRGTGGRDGIPFLFVGGTSVLVLESRAVDGQTLKIPALVLVNTEKGDRRTVYEGRIGEGLSEIELSADRLSVNVKATAAYPDLTTGNYKVTLSDGSKTGIPASVPAPSDSRIYITSPSGDSRLFVEDRDGKSDLYTIDKTGAEKRLTTLGSVTIIPSPTYDANGGYAIFTVVRSSEQAFYIVSLKGGEPKKLVDITLDN